MRRFGVRRGLRNCARVRFGRPELRLDLGSGTPLLARSGTSDWETFCEVFLDRCYADDFLTLFGDRQLPEEVETVLDVGANVGYAARYFADRYPNAQVWAIEPDRGNFDMLERNCRGIDRIHPVLGALWSEAGPLRVVDDGSGHNGVHVERGGTDVQGHTLGDLIAMTGSEMVDVLKIDIEGAERVVFDAVEAEWLEHIGLVLIELHDWKCAGSSKAFHRALDRVEYDEFALGGVVAARLRHSRP